MRLSSSKALGAFMQSSVRLQVQLARSQRQGIPSLTSEQAYTMLISGKVCFVQEHFRTGGSEQECRIPKGCMPYRQHRPPQSQGCHPCEALSHCRLYASICRAGMLANEGNACGRYQEDLASTCVILLPWLTVSILA